MIKKIKVPLLFFIVAIVLSQLLFHFNLISFQILVSLSLGILIPFINFLIFYTLFSQSFNKSNKIFLIFNLGGMVFRLILMLAALFITLKYLNIDVYGFIFVFFLWYVLLLVYEIILIKNKLEKQLKSTKNA